MKRKRLLLMIGCLAAALLAGYGMLRLTAPRHRITERNVEAIKKGMSELEVEALLGAKAGVYTSRRQTGYYVVWVGEMSSLVKIRWPLSNPCRTGYELVQEAGGKEWVAEEISVYIRFDEAGRVVNLLSELPNRNESFLARLRRWLGM